MNKKLFVAAALLVLNAQAEATVVYTYVGENFTTINDNTPPLGTYDTSMKVTGSITLALTQVPGVPVFIDNLFPNLRDFSFSDGRGTISKGNGGKVDLTNFQFDASGNIAQWAIELGDNAVGFPVPAHLINSFSSAFDGGLLSLCTDATCGSRTFDSGLASPRGVWQRQSPVPLPGTLGLLSMSLLGLTNLRRKLFSAV